MEPEKHKSLDNKNLPQPQKMKSYSENMGCFGLSKLMAIACRPHNKQDGHEFRKILQSSRFNQLEKLYYEHEQRSQKTQMDNVLAQILQIQEVQSVREYTINGNTFKVRVVEDTEF